MISKLKELVLIALPLSLVVVILGLVLTMRVLDFSTGVQQELTGISALKSTFSSSGLWGLLQLAKAPFLMVFGATTLALLIQSWRANQKNA